MKLYLMACETSIKLVGVPQVLLRGYYVVSYNAINITVQSVNMMSKND